MATSSSSVVAVHRSLLPRVTRLLQQLPKQQQQQHFQPHVDSTASGTPLPPPPFTAASLLFVPGHRPELFSKALSGPSDIVCFELEDGVPRGLKHEAARHVSQALAAICNVQAEEQGRQHRRPRRVAVRINPLHGDRGCDDLDTIFACIRDRARDGEHRREGGDGLTRGPAQLVQVPEIVVPKVNTAADLHDVASLVCNFDDSAKAT